MINIKSSLDSQVDMSNVVYMYNLPYPPSLNRAYRTYKGRIILSAVARDYIQAVKLAVGIALNLSGRLAVVINVYPPDKRRRDIANCEKLLCDSMTKAGVWVDDSLIDDLHIIRHPVAKGGRIVVAVSLIG